MIHSSRTTLPVTCVLLALTGCGGTTNEGGAFGLQTESSPGGIWSGLELVEGEPVLETLVLITQAGRLHAIREDGVQSIGQASARRGEVSATYTAALPLGEVFEDGSNAGTGSFVGQIFTGVSIDGSFVFDTAQDTRTEGLLALDFVDDYNRSSSLDDIAGLWASPGLTLDVSATGEIFGQAQDTGCIINGTVSIIDPLYTLYDVSWEYTACAAPLDSLNGVSFAGMVALIGSPEEPDEDPTGPAVIFGGAVGTVSGADVAVELFFER